MGGPGAAGRLLLQGPAGTNAACAPAALHMPLMQYLAYSPSLQQVRCHPAETLVYCVGSATGGLCRVQGVEETDEEDHQDRGYRRPLCG